jgi:hypothetical protein
LDAGATSGFSSLSEPRKEPVELAEIVRITVLQGLVAALVSVIGTVFLSVALERMAGLGDQGVASEAYEDLALAHTAPMHISLIDNASTSPTALVDVWIHWPILLFTLVVLAACGMAGWRTARVTRAGPGVGLGVAVVYATITTVFIYVGGAYAQIGSLLANTLRSANPYAALLSLDPAQNWWHAFSWAVVPALVGAGAVRRIEELLKSRWDGELLEQWRTGVVGALWAVASCLVLCGGATLIALWVWVNGTPTLSGSFSKAASLFLASLPVWCSYALTLGVGASLQFSASLGQLGSASLPSASLLGRWPLTTWAYLLPLLVITGFLIGAAKAHSRLPGRATAFYMIIPFALFNVVVAWLAGASTNVRLSQDFVSRLGQYIGSLAPDTRARVTAAMTGSGVRVAYGPALIEVVVGSIVLGLLAATLVYFWLGPEADRQLASAPAPAGPSGETGFLSQPLHPPEPGMLSHDSSPAAPEATDLLSRGTEPDPPSSTAPFE